MKNVDMKVTGKKLVITVDLAKKHGLSSSGKSEIIASTEGNMEVPNSDGAIIGLNIYKKVT
jgi:hypothetical protein